MFLDLILVTNYNIMDLWHWRTINYDNLRDLWAEVECCLLLAQITSLAGKAAASSAWHELVSSLQKDPANNHAPSTSQPSTTLSLNAARHAARFTSVVKGLWLQVQCNQRWTSMACDTTNSGVFGRCGESSQILNRVN